MNAREAWELFAYSRWAHARVWGCIERLSDAQYTADTGYAFESVAGQVAHVMSVDRRWFARLGGQALPERLTVVELPTIQTARAQWDAWDVENEAVLKGLPDAAWDETIAYYMPHRGGMKHNTRADILRHVVNHGTDHRAQILSMLHGLGAPTVEQDMMFYLWEQAD